MVLVEKFMKEKSRWRLANKREQLLIG